MSVMINVESDEGVSGMFEEHKRSWLFFIVSGLAGIASLACHCERSNLNNRVFF